MHTLLPIAFVLVTVLPIAPISHSPGLGHAAPFLTSLWNWMTARNNAPVANTGTLDTGIGSTRSRSSSAQVERVPLTPPPEGVSLTPHGNINPSSRYASAAQSEADAWNIPHASNDPESHFTRIAVQPGQDVHPRWNPPRYNRQFPFRIETSEGFEDINPRKMAYVAEKVHNDTLNYFLSVPDPRKELECHFVFSWSPYRLCRNKRMLGGNFLAIRKLFQEISQDRPAVAKYQLRHPAPESLSWWQSSWKTYDTMDTGGAVSGHIAEWRLLFGGECGFLGLFRNCAVLQIRQL